MKVEKLARRHQKLHSAVEKAQKAAECSFKLQNMKKKKLRAKDQLEMARRREESMQDAAE